MDDLQTLAMAQGYAFSILRSIKRKGYASPIRYDIVCICHGNPPPENPNRRRKEKSSLRCGCPFSAKAVYRKGEQLWELVIVKNEHNHFPHDRPDELCAHRRRLRQEDASFETHLERLSLVGTKTAREIAEELECLYMDDEGNRTKRISPKDVTNAQNALIRRKYGPFSSTQLFLHILEESPNVVYRIHRGNDGKIDAVFFSFHCSLELWKRNPEVLSFDNTYRVNRFNMPLLQVTGTTALHTTFTVGFCLVSSETEAAFLWPLQVLRETAEQRGIPYPQVILSDMCLAFKNAANNVFPYVQQQLCVWHVLKNVLHYIRTHWNGEDRPNNNGGDTNANSDNEAEDDEVVNQFLLPAQYRQDSAASGRKFENSPDGCMQACCACVHAVTEDAFLEAWQTIQTEFLGQQCKYPCYIFYMKI